MIHSFDLALPHGITLACRANGEAGAARPRIVAGRSLAASNTFALEASLN